ncbi:hypothetical protein [Salinibacter altiplanensis]|uniref:hypothetical protein n=1 Tax=Salinibacter altiplanensis TaxID=1803181 RepID=UPI000C9F30C6|nr:hypothetical protein [Salinibacter altiplanensis]
MADDPIDELEVLLSLDLEELEDELEEAVDKFQRLDNQSTEDAQDELDDAAEAADDLSDKLDKASREDVDVDVDDGEVSQLQRRLQALDGRDVAVDLKFDEGRNRIARRLSGRGGSSSKEGIFGGNRLPGELDEVQEGFAALSAVPPQLKAVGAAAATAAAAIGAGAGLAGVATKLAAEFGPAGLQNDVKAAGATFKETGRDFAEAFSGVIRSEVLPAARGLAAAVRGADDALAVFSSGTIEFLKQLPGAGPAFGALVNAGRAGDSGRAGVLQGVGNVTGLREIERTLINQVERVRDRFERDLIPKKEMLSQVKDFRLDAVKNLQKLQQKFPDAFPESTLDAFVAKLKQVRKRLEEVSSVSLEGVAPQPADAEQVDTAPRESSGDSLSENIAETSPVPMGGTGGAEPLLRQARMTRRAFFKIRQQIRASITQMSSLARVGVQAFAQLGSVMGSTVGQAFTDLIRNAVGFENKIGSIAEAFKSLGRAAIGVLQQVITKLASAAAIAAILGPILGVSSAGFGSVFSSLIGGGGIPGLAVGGRIEESGIARVHKGEQVVPEGMVSRIQGLVRQTAQLNAAALAGRSAAGGMNVTVNVEGDRRTDGRDLKTAYDTTTRIQKRKGR